MVRLQFFNEMNKIITTPLKNVKTIISPTYQQGLSDIELTRSDYGLKDEIKIKRNDFPISYQSHAPDRFRNIFLATILCLIQITCQYNK